MSEEKPVFKVTDRRLFNPDGSPRFVEDEEKPAPSPVSVEAAHAAAPVSASAAAPPAAPTTTAATAAASSGGDASPPTSTARPRAESAGNEPDATTAGRGDAARREDEAGAADDPTNFANLLMFIASPAAAAMGMTEHPGLGPGEIDLPLAKHCIDLLGTLQHKTRGSLGQQEQQMLEGLLGELRMQYVSLTGTTAARPRGFSGNDITGGR